MLLLKGELFILVVFLAGKIQTKLMPSGKNVCLKSETYTEKVVEESRTPAQVIKKKFCWNFSSWFRCNEVIKNQKDFVKTQNINRTRIVPTCCDGYTEINSECQPVCQNECKNGKCIAPETCDCFHGYFGVDCNAKCNEGFWGKNCSKKCNCLNNGKCNRFYGVCKCEDGWTGERCESPCENGYYGYECTKQCNCDDSNCDHKTGECLTTTTTQPETTTTTEPPTTEKSYEDLQTTEESQILTENSITFQITEKEVIVEEETKTIINEIETRKVVGYSEMTEPRKNSEVNSSELIFDKNVSVDIFTNETTTEMSKETKIIDYVGSETDFHETSTNNNRQSEVTNNIDEILNSETPSAPTNSTISDTIQINYSGSKPVIDKTETDNFINEKKGSSNKKTMLTILHFLPGLSVFSSVSFVIFLIGTMWLIRKHRNRTRKMAIPTTKQNKLLQLEDQIKYPTENFFWSDNCINNTDIMSDADFNRKTPTMETFKPLTNDKSSL